MKFDGFCRRGSLLFGFSEFSSGNILRLRHKQVCSGNVFLLGYSHQFVRWYLWHRTYCPSNAASLPWIFALASGGEILDPTGVDLLLFGIQGSGKGTQAKRLAAEFGYDIFEAGGELRKIAASGSELGKTVSSYIDKGNLVPFEIIIRVVKEAILARPKGQKILFDGIPRDLDQMREFDRIMREVGRKFFCIELLIPEEVAIARLLGRAKAEGRVDDTSEEFIRRRLQIFLEKTRPVIREYAKRGNMKQIDGIGSVEEIYERLKKALS